VTDFFRRSAAILLCLAGCLAMPVQSQPAGKLLIGLGTHPTLIYGVHYLMVSRGFLKEEGLDAEFVVLDGTATLVTQIAQKRIFTAWPNPDALIISRQPGRDPLPLRCAYNGVRPGSLLFRRRARSRPWLISRESALA
jgi:NitT/TauT family transport system substrate-binding protein